MNNTLRLFLLPVAVTVAASLTLAQPAAPTPAAAAAATPAAPPAPADAGPFKFAFGSATPAAGFTAVRPDTIYSKAAGFGFEAGAKATDDNAAASGVKQSIMLDFAPAKNIKVGGTGTAAFLTSARPFYFSVAVPEGNYRVTVTFGDPAAASENTVKAELRRLMLESVHTDAGQVVTKSFIVNVRQPQYPGGAVRLKSPRESVDEFWGWDDKLTLEFNGAHPAVRSVEIAKADVPTVYIVGDSTSCDQSKEPWTSWGQMFTNFFKPEIAIANHGESGEAVASSLGAHRFDKVYSLLKAGDYVFVQFGHNDMKGGNVNNYQASLGRIADEIKKRGATFVLVTPVERSNGANNNTLAGYPDAVRAVAKEKGVTLVDLHDLSQVLYRAIGDNLKEKAFQDGTHHNKYGAYEIAKCVVAGLQAAKSPLAQYVADGFAFDPAKPDPVADFKVPASGVVNPSQRPAGD